MCRGPVWEFADQIHIKLARLMRFVSNWFSDPAHRLLRHTFRWTFYILDDLGLDGYAATAGAL